GYALVVILIGLLTLAQYLFGVSIGIDHLVFLPPAVAAPYFQTGPMEIETATNFILIGVALVLINIRGYRTVVRLLIGLVVAICVSSLLGLFRGITLPPSSPPVAPMAALTVAMFFLLCVGLLLAGRQFDQTDQNWPPNTPP
ncbi:MAG: hypothetical protein N2689_15700, partial [Verrucomicrobiae bacterium]|nr:hypothetical protein [Verrucomicrobiae bacterium]